MDICKRWKTLVIQHTHSQLRLHMAIVCLFHLPFCKQAYVSFRGLLIQMKCFLLLTLLFKVARSTVPKCCPVFLSRRRLCENTCDKLHSGLLNTVSLNRKNKVISWWVDRNLILYVYHLRTTVQYWLIQHPWWCSRTYCFLVYNSRQWGSTVFPASLGI